VQAVKGIVEINGRLVTGIDFTEAQLNGWRLRKSEILNSTFDRARCIEWVLWHSAVRDSSFERANMRGSMLGSYPEGGRIVWENVNFIGADLRDVSAYGAIFRGCNFSRARLEKAIFNQCDFSNCRFAGRVEEVVFDGRKLPGQAPCREMELVDFTEATFANVEFRGYSLNAVQLPRDPDVLLIRRLPCVARRVTEMLATDRSTAARIVHGVLTNSLRSPVEHPDESWVFNRRDWQEWGGDETRELAERAMRQAEADCLQGPTPAWPQQSAPMG